MADRNSLARAPVLLRRIVSAWVLVLSLGLACVAVANETSFVQGQQAYAERNFSLAFEHWNRAAESGHARALNGLGLLYRDGKGIEKDEKRAVSLFRSASERGFSYAMFNLGMMIRDGRGVDGDDVEACKWFILAATLNFDPKARLQRDLIARRMSPEQYAESERRAQEWTNLFFFGDASR
jgi:TPR repeat protein